MHESLHPTTWPKHGPSDLGSTRQRCLGKSKTQLGLISNAEVQFRNNISGRAPGSHTRGGGQATDYAEAPIAHSRQHAVIRLSITTFELPRTFSIGRAVFFLMFLTQGCLLLTNMLAQPPDDRRSTRLISGLWSKLSSYLTVVQQPIEMTSLPRVHGE